MARPSKLTEKQWTEIERRVPPAGNESIRSVAKEYGVSEGVIRKRVKTHTKPINALANQLAAAEMELEKLPLSTQCKVRTLADSLKGISENLAGAAEYGAMTAHKLAKVAHIQAAKISEHENDPVRPDDLKGIAALTNLANQASNIGIGLIAATKGQVKADSIPDSAKLLTDDELAAIIANGSA